MESRHGRGQWDMKTEEPYRGNQRNLFHGKAFVLVRTLRAAVALTLTATASGLKAATLNIVPAKECGPSGCAVTQDGAIYYFINSASLSFTAAPQISYPLGCGCRLSARNVSGRKYPFSSRNLAPISM